jgi:hypothetical protein
MHFKCPQVLGFVVKMMFLLHKQASLSVLVSLITGCLVTNPQLVPTFLVGAGER